MSKKYFVVWSGDGVFKLLTRRKRDPIAIAVDAKRDRATRYSALGRWPGTVIGVDIANDAYEMFAGFMSQMRDIWGVDVRAQKKDVHKKRARFA